MNRVRSVLISRISLQRFALPLLLVVTAGVSACAQWVAPPDLITPSPDAPVYVLSNLRAERNDGDPGFAVDFVRTQKGEETVSVSLVAKSPRGEVRIIGDVIPNKDSGTIRLTQPSRIFGTLSDLEFYVKGVKMWAEERFAHMLVSNTVEIGNPGPATTARAWNEAEQAAYEKHQLGKKPPSSLPPGHELLTISSPAVAGMPIKVARFGEWVDGELISLADKQVVVKVSDKASLMRLQRYGWVAVASDVLARAADQPESFTPSVRVLPGGLLNVPADTVPLEPKLRLFAGTPLLMEHLGKWQEVYVLQANEQQVSVLVKDFMGASNRQLPRSKLLITNTTLARLNEPGTADAFAANTSGAASGPLSRIQELQRQRMEARRRPFGPPSRAQQRAGMHAASDLWRSREWTDASGRYKVQAQLVGKDGDEVTLRADDGRVIQLSLEKLSPADRALLEELPETVRPK